VNYRIKEVTYMFVRLSFFKVHLASTPKHSELVANLLTLSGHVEHYLVRDRFFEPKKSSACRRQQWTCPKPIR